MRIVVRNLLPHAHADIERADCIAHSGEEQAVVMLCRAETTLVTAAEIAGLWWPVCGSTMLATSDYSVQIGPRCAYVTDVQRAHEVFMGSNCLVLALLATQAGWNVLLGGNARRNRSRDQGTFPALHALCPAMRRRLLRVVRAARATQTHVLGAADIAPAARVLDQLQKGFVAAIERCPGRTAAKQRSVFLRLQRVRNMLSLSTESELEMSDVARATNYSLWRFIRVFAQVFGETPYAFISRRRIDRARGMLLDTKTAVSDVAAAVGFETRAAMTRAIRKRFGVSASALRAAHGADLAAGILCHSQDQQNYESHPV